MLNTLEKVKRLENYLSIDNIAIDPVIELTINKLLMREYHRVTEIKKRLTNEISLLEQQYGMDSNSFQQRYQAGKLDDEMDFIEWSASLEMLNQIENQLNGLASACDK